MLLISLMLTSPSAENVYFTDIGSHRIRKVTMSTSCTPTASPTALVSTGIITTVAGTGSTGYSGDGGAATSASFNRSPRWRSGVAVDSSGSNKSIAHTSMLHVSHVQSIGNLYIADGSNNRVRKITVYNGIITTIAGTGATDGGSGYGGATGTALKDPVDVALDASGRVSSFFFFSFQLFDNFLCTLQEIFIFAT